MTGHLGRHGGTIGSTPGVLQRSNTGRLPEPHLQVASRYVRRNLGTPARSGAHVSGHPTTKPVALVERAIRNSSKQRDTVLDPFGGSGTTMIAAERTGRRAVLLEIDPAYVDVMVRRWQDITGEVAVLEGEDRTFDDVAVMRCASKAATAADHSASVALASG